MNKQNIPAISLSFVLGTFGSLNASAAELRSFAYSAIQPDKTVAPLKPGIPYCLPKSRVVVRFIMFVEKQYVLETTQGNSPDTLELKKNPPQYVVRIEPPTNSTLTVTLADDPNLAFYLTSESSFLTDSSDGTVQFLANSARLSQIGVSYNDKTAEFIQGTVKLLGETVGIAARAAVAFSADANQKILIRERIQGVELTVEKEIDVRDAVEVNVDNEHNKLSEALAQRFRSLDKQPLPPGSLKKAKILLMVSGLPQTAATAELVLSKSDNSTKKLKYYPGVIYRSPEAATMTLSSVEAEVKLDSPTITDDVSIPLAELKSRLPEAGRFGWVELSSKVFATVHPVVNFQEDGAIKSYSFSSATKVEELKKVMDQISTSAGSVVDQLKTNKDAAKQAEQAKKQSEAQLKYDIVKLEAQETKLTEEIAELETKIASDALKPEEKDALVAQLRQKRSELSQLSERLEILKGQHIRVDP
jgi:hypothetical protein